MAGVWIREPLLHFICAGLLIFLFFAWRGDDVDPASRTIDITEAQVARLSAGWERAWRRPPTPSEIDALIRDHIKEEIYYREALRLGLDNDDGIIRRRLRSKMEYLAAAQIENVRPDNAILQAWLDRHPARFAYDVRISFDQIYLGAGGNVQTVLNKLAAGEDWKTQGDAISLPRTMDEASHSDVAETYGPSFAEALSQSAKNAWVGPVTSGFGQHLVRVRQISTPPKPALSDVRQAVENDWRAVTFKQREAKAYQALLDGYNIKIANP